MTTGSTKPNWSNNGQNLEEKTYPRNRGPLQRAWPRATRPSRPSPPPAPRRTAPVRVKLINLTFKSNFTKTAPYTLHPTPYTLHPVPVPRRSRRGRGGARAPIPQMWREREYVGESVCVRESVCEKEFLSVCVCVCVCECVRKSVFERECVRERERERPGQRRSRRGRGGARARGVLPRAPGCVLCTHM